MVTGEGRGRARRPRRPWPGRRTPAVSASPLPRGRRCGPSCPWILAGWADAGEVEGPSDLQSHTHKATDSQQMETGSWRGVHDRRHSVEQLDTGGGPHVHTATSAGGLRLRTRLCPPPCLGCSGPLASRDSRKNPLGLSRSRALAAGSRPRASPLPPGRSHLSTS